MVLYPCIATTICLGSLVEQVNVHLLALWLGLVFWVPLAPLAPNLRGGGIILHFQFVQSLDNAACIVSIFAKTCTTIYFRPLPLGFIQREEKQRRRTNVIPCCAQVLLLVAIGLRFWEELRSRVLTQDMDTAVTTSAKVQPAAKAEAALERSQIMHQAAWLLFSLLTHLVTSYHGTIALAPFSNAVQHYSTFSYGSKLTDWCRGVHVGFAGTA